MSSYSRGYADGSGRDRDRSYNGREGIDRKDGHYSSSRKDEMASSDNSRSRYSEKDSSYSRGDSSRREDEHKDRGDGDRSHFSSRDHSEYGKFNDNRDRDSYYNSSRHDGDRRGGGAGTGTSNRGHDRQRRGSYDEEPSSATGRYDRDRRSLDKPRSRDSNRDRDYYDRARDDGYYADTRRRRRSGDGDDVIDGRRRDRHWREEDDRGRRDGGGDRKKRRMDERDEGRGRIKPRKKMWPPQFESSGASYVFDARSGLFYEAASDFFYDPKQKLYYGNRQKAYFQYSEKDDPPYIQVAQPDGNDGGLTAVGDASTETNVDNAQDLVVQALQGGKNLLSEKKKSDKNKIAICIKKKTLTSSKKTSSQASSATLDTTTDVTAPSHTQKKHEVDMEKWSQRVREMRDEDTTQSNTNEECKDEANLSCKAVSPTKIKMTASGKPICLICKRKFASIEKLRQHEKLSKLHQANLAKKKAQEAIAVTTAKPNEKEHIAPKVPNPEYRDRAKERRTMYVPEHSSGIVEVNQSIVDMGPSLDRARTVGETETVAPDQCLGETNVGNKLLRSLGWKGGSLGRANANGDISMGEDGVEGKLKQDWKRIETIASGNVK